MDVSIKFLGAARSVTGSKHLLEIDKKKILVDCGCSRAKRNYAFAIGINFRLIRRKLI